MIRLGRALVLLVAMGMVPSLCSAQGGAVIFRTKKCRPLPQPRQMHGSAVIGPRLYVFGGNNVGGYLNDVVSAEILADGNLGEWRTEQPLPDFRHYIGTAVEVVNNHVYLVGGGTVPAANSPESATVRLADVLYTTVNADGTLLPWKRSKPFSAEAATCISTCTDDEHLYVVGGNLKNGVSNKIYVGDLSDSGEPVNWRPASTLKKALWYQGSAILNGRMYVWGGLAEKGSTSANKAVYSADVSGNGTLGPWQEGPELPNGIYGSAFCGFNDYLIAVAGRYTGAVTTNDILFTRLENSMPAAWTVMKSDLETRIYPALGLDKSRGWIFVTGGKYMKDAAVLDAIQAFQVTQPAESKLDLAANSGDAASQVGNAKDLFQTAPEAINAASAAKTNAVLFFYSPEVPACKRAWELLSKPSIRNGKVKWAGIDVSKTSKDLMAKYGVFKVPALVLVDGAGKQLKKQTSVDSEKAVVDMLASR